MNTTAKALSAVVALALCASPLLAVPYTWRFAKDGDFLGWRAEGYRRAEVVGGVFRGITNKFSFLYSPKLDLDASQNAFFVFRARSSRDGTGSIYFRHAGEEFSEERRLNFVVSAGKRPRRYQVRVADNPRWTGVIEDIRFDVLYVPDTRVEITEMAFTNETLKADAGPENLLANADFEMRTPDGKGGPEDWEIARHGAAECAVTQSGRGGAALKLACKGEGSRVAVRQPLSFDYLGSYEVALDYQAEGFGRGDSLAVTLGFDDIFGKPLSRRTYTATAAASGWKRLTRAFSLPEQAAFGHIEIAAEGRKATTLIDSVSLRRVKPPPVTDTKPFTWEAEWIWHPESREDDKAPVFFRRTLQLPDDDAVQDARLIVTADNSCRLYVNGKAVPQGPFYNDWQNPDIYDIAPHLTKGSNVLCVAATNAGGPAGLLLEAGLRLDSGKHIYLVSGPAWKCSREASAGWTESGLDDRGWSNAQSLGRPPTQPWGDRMASYTYLGPCAEIDVRNLSLPKATRPGQELQYSMDLTLRGELPPQAQLFVEIARSGADSGTLLLRKKLSLLRSSATEGKLSISRYLSPGDYELRTGVTTTRLIAGAGTTALERNGVLTSPIAIAPVNDPVRNPVARIRTADGAPRFVINGREHTALHYLVDYTTVPDLIDNCRDNGIHIYMLNVSDIPWTAPDKHDFSRVDEICSSLLLQDPDAYFILALALDDINSFGKVLNNWTDAYPGERVVTSEGVPDIPDYGGNNSNAPSMASIRWQDAAEDLVRELIRHTRANRYGERVIGYLPASGVTYEWQQWASVAWPAVFVDYSDPARLAFVQWAKNNYADISALNAAWKTGFTSFDDIAIPSKDERVRSDVGVFLDPEKSRREIDYRTYYSEQVADVILRLARAIKEETEGESLCGVFYGYVTHVLGPYRYQLVGHSALRKILDSPDIDFLMSPSDYGDREIGGGSGFMSATDSVKLHGKAWIDQADLRTFRTTQNLGRLADLSDSKAGWIRHFGSALVSGVCEQIYDFSQGWTSGDPRLMRLLGRLRDMEERTMNVSRGAEAAEHSIAVIVDEKSTYYTAMPSGIHVDTVVAQLPQLCRSGVGFDTYLLDDLPKMPPYKCYLFLNTFRITRDQEAFIDGKLKRDGKTLIFVYAPGITDEERLLPERVSDITGIRMEVLPQERPLGVSLANTDHPAAQRLKDIRSYGFGNPYSLVFAPMEGEALGTPNGLPDKPGLVIKRNPGWTSVFSSAPGLPAHLLRGIADLAGVRVSNPTDGDITYIGDRIIVVHTASGGRRLLRCRSGTKLVEEMVTGRTHSVSNGRFAAELPPRSTSIFLTH